MNNVDIGPHLIGIDIIGQSVSTTVDIFLCLQDPLNPLTISFSTILSVDNYEPRKTKMNKDMLQALKYYQQRAADLTCTVPEAQGCNPTPAPNSFAALKAKRQKEKDMYNERNTAISVNPSIRIEPTNAFDAVETAQDHLIERLSEATEKKIAAARKTFAMDNDERPRTAQALVDRIITGKFYIPEDRKNAYTYDPSDYIQWRDPAAKKDEAGFDAARETINLASDDVMDILIVKGAEAGLAAINEYKKTTIH